MRIECHQLLGLIASFLHCTQVCNKNCNPCRGYKYDSTYTYLQEACRVTAPHLFAHLQKWIPGPPRPLVTPTPRSPPPPPARPTPNPFLQSAHLSNCPKVRLRQYPTHPSISLCSHAHLSKWISVQGPHGPWSPISQKFSLQP